MFGAKRLKLRHKLATASAGLLLAAGNTLVADGLNVQAQNAQPVQPVAQRYADYYAGSQSIRQPLSQPVSATPRSTETGEIQQASAENFPDYFAQTAAIPTYRVQGEQPKDDGVTMQFQQGHLVSMMQPAPVQSQQPVAPASAPVTQTSFSPFGDLNLSLDSVADGHSESAASGTPNDVVSGGEQAVVRASNDVGTILGDSNQATGISLFRRPNMSTPNIRGYDFNRIYTQMNGAYWSYSRPDLDSIVSKIDAGIIEDVVVIKGPYSALYGPGFAFIDIVTAPTLRSYNECDVVSEFRTVLNFETNGGGAYGRQVAEVGGVDWGARINFGFRGGVDYTAGDGSVIDANYESRDIEFTLGYDLAGGELEFQYLRLDTTDAIFHNQPAAIDFLVTNGFSLKYENYDEADGRRLLAEGWYNNTSIGQGANQQLGLPNGGTIQIEEDTEQSSTGGRVALSAGDLDCGDCSSLTVGADIRHLRQSILEDDTFAGGPGLNGLSQRDLPSGTESTNPGLFFQTEGYLRDGLTAKFGGRLDFVDQTVGDYRVDPVFTTVANAGDRDFTLWSLFLTTEYEIDETYSLTAGVGHGERAPSLSELYTDQLFIAGNQSGYTFFVGNKDLRKERATQVDLGLQAGYDYSQFGVRGYYSYISDYITPTFLDGNEVDFGVDHGYGYINSDSSLWGIEFNGQAELTENLSAFGNLSYQEGRDEDLFNDNLFGIYPFQSRVGLRYERGNRCRGWGAEVSARMVADQELLADNPDRFVFGQGNAMAGPEQRTPGFTTFDARTYYRMNQNWLLTAGVLNLGDALYLEHRDYRQTPFISRDGKPGTPAYQPGINFYFGTEVTF